MQCSRTISFAQITYNKCLRITDCNLVCSLKQESHTAPFMLSIHSPDNVFMILVSIFISNHNHFCVLCFRLAKDVRTYVRSYSAVFMSRALRCQDKTNPNTVSNHTQTSFISQMNSISDHLSGSFDFQKYY